MIIFGCFRFDSKKYFESDFVFQELSVFFLNHSRFLVDCVCVFSLHFNHIESPEKKMLVKSLTVSND